MSTKSSLEFSEWKETKSFHIYREAFDDFYYLETEDGRIKIPEKFAKRFAKVLQGFNEEQHKQKVK